MNSVIWYMPWLCAQIWLPSPYTIKADFVEAPSQFLENFCWEYPSLKIFAKNYKTGAVLPESLFNKMKATEHVLMDYYYMFQVYYGMIDFTFEDKYDSISGMDLTTVSETWGASLRFHCWMEPI